MTKHDLSRREFLGAAAAGASTAAWALANPGRAAAQSVGIKPGDLPDLTIKEAKIYVAELGDIRRLNTPESGEIVSLVTHSGIEGNYALGNRGATPGWLEFAKAAVVGKNVVDLLPTLTATTGMRTGGPMFAAARGGGGAGGRGGAGTGRGGGGGGRGAAAWPNYITAACDVCLWDIMGKAVNRPIYKLLGGTKDRMVAYASTQHLANVEDFAPLALECKAQGFKAFKIHPGGGQRRTGPAIPAYVGHMEELKEVRKAVGDDYVLMHDPVQRYSLFEALKVGRLMDELGYVSYEDPVRTTDIDSLIELRKTLDVKLDIGEFITSIAGFADYINKGALDVVRLIADNVGGISGSMRVGMLADSFGLECTPHNWGNVMDLAVHFQLELALPNANWFEMPIPPSATDRVYHKDKFRIDKDGYVMAPTAPGLGYPLDRDALDKITKRIDR